MNSIAFFVVSLGDCDRQSLRHVHKKFWTGGNWAKSAVTDDLESQDHCYHFPETNKANSESHEPHDPEKDDDQIPHALGLLVLKRLTMELQGNL